MGQLHSDAIPKTAPGRCLDSVRLAKIPVQMWLGGRNFGADVARGEPTPGADVARGEPTPGADGYGEREG